MVGMDSTDMVVVLKALRLLIPLQTEGRNQYHRSQSLDGRTLDPDGHQSQNQIHLNQSLGGQ